MFYFQRYARATYVAIDPMRPGVEIVDAPITQATCSDCPPLTSAQFRDRSWDLLSNDVSVAFDGETIRCVYYRGEGPFRTHMILLLRQDGDEEVVVEREEKRGTLMSIASLRVSPDERFLAYVVDSKKQAFLAGPREELFIKELATGREKRIAKYGYMGNLIWSPDGDRLYFAGGEYSSDSAVRVVDAAATFAR